MHITHFVVPPCTIVPPCTTTTRATVHHHTTVYHLRPLRPPAYLSPELRDRRTPVHLTPLQNFERPLHPPSAHNRTPPCTTCAHMRTYLQSSVIAALPCSSRLSRTSSAHCAHRAPTAPTERPLLLPRTPTAPTVPTSNPHCAHLWTIVVAAHHPVASVQFRP